MKEIMSLDKMKAIGEESDIMSKIFLLLSLILLFSGLIYLSLLIFSFYFLGLAILFMINAKYFYTKNIMIKLMKNLNNTEVKK